MGCLFRLNDRVWSIDENCWGIVKDIKEELNNSPYVEFDNGKSRTYTCDGRLARHLAGRVLFFDKVTVPESALIRPRKSYIDMLRECDRLDFIPHKRNYYICIHYNYPDVENPRVQVNFSTSFRSPEITYISKEDAEYIVEECKENNL